ncbi:hypothetical protein ABVT39_016284, partial [Epinephelus coioides]
PDNTYHLSMCALGSQDVGIVRRVVREGKSNSYVRRARPMEQGVNRCGLELVSRHYESRET